MVQTKRSRKSRDFSTVNPAAAAIDIGATIHVAAVGPDRDKAPVRTFRTFTDDLHRLADWFAECGIRTVVMESTGVYWIPIFEILEQRGFQVMVVNAGREPLNVLAVRVDRPDATVRSPVRERQIPRGTALPVDVVVSGTAWRISPRRLLPPSAWRRWTSSSGRSRR